MRGIVRPPLAAAAHPAAAGQHSRPVPPQPPVRRLLPLASVPPTGADEPPRSHSAYSRRGAAGECCGGAPASQGGRCYRTFQIPCAAQDSLPPGRTVAPRRKLRPAVRRRRTNPESGARFLQNSCTRNRKSRPKRRLFSLLDNIGSIFRFCDTRNTPFSSLPERDRQPLFGVFDGK